ncbi:hypothetical protein DFP73DRAFT_535288 [Morchella snyderi]|nr:hypothetical protein DFP73DRAFT_535288 [Morchella snyderi]
MVGLDRCPMWESKSWGGGGGAFMKTKKLFLLFLLLFLCLHVTGRDGDGGTESSVYLVICATKLIPFKAGLSPPAAKLYMYVAEVE